eukprot:scaffold394_cov166-Amphora_coffeaeformis.AAC.9
MDALVVSVGPPLYVNHRGCQRGRRTTGAFRTSWGFKASEITRGFVHAEARRGSLVCTRVVDFRVFLSTFFPRGKLRGLLLISRSGMVILSFSSILNGAFLYEGNR